MNTSSHIYISHEWIGFHYWKDAPDKYAYLRAEHRHKFTAWIRMDVFHDDREVEFHEVQTFLQQLPMFAAMRQVAQPWSCERMASVIAESLWVRYGKRYVDITVLEDGEHGGGVTWTP